MLGYNNQFVVQGVHMVFDGSIGPSWQDNETRKSTLVLIGRNLQVSNLEMKFHDCIAKKNN